MSNVEDKSAEQPDYSLAQVAEHDSKDSLWVSIHEKVYNVSKFVDEHPGGEEVLLDVAGTDATEAFEDVGHSDEAREILAGLLIGNLKRGEGDPLPSSVRAPSGGSSDDSGSGGVPSIVFALLALIVAGGAYYYMEFIQKQQQA